MKKRELWYDTSARAFNEALPIGNGSFGAVIYGGVPKETISLNLDTFWSGCPSKDEKKISPLCIQKIRQQILKREYKTAQEDVEKSLLGHYTESYLPFGAFWYEIGGIREVAEYKRRLDIQEAAAYTAYDSNLGHFESSIFASYPDNCIAGKIANIDEHPFHIKMGFKSSLRSWIQTDLSACQLSLVMDAPSHVEPNYVKSHNPIVYDEKHPGMKGICTAWFRTRGGIVSMSEEEGTVSVCGATEVEFYLTGADGYRGYGKSLEYRLDEIMLQNVSCLEKLKYKSYKEIQEKHRQDYQQLYGSVEIDLKSERHSDLPTDRRIREFRDGRDDAELFELYFQYGRYLLIACSRKGSQPANLQGIWNESERPVWSCNWTININTQMNYWIAAPCNLLDCYMPFLDLADELHIAGRETAAEQFSCRGWVANHNVDLWRQTSPVAGHANYAYWPMGGIWLANQIVDYYRYTIDRDVLKEKILPIVEEAAVFSMDWMFMGEDGKYHTAPSTSPENIFLDQNSNEAAVSDTCTMDVSLITELLNNLLRIYEILGFEKMMPLYRRAEEYLNRMPEFKVGSKGQLLEWSEEFEAKDPGHRHFSPVVGFHPGRVINKYVNRELVDACEKMIDLRLQNGSGHIGWSCAWLINIYARLGNGEKAFSFLKQLLADSTYDNLFDLHPPLGENEGEREAFQIDGNLGGAAGMAAMFLQSYLGEIELLPALPKEWANGKVEGLLSEGGFKVDIEWKEFKVQTVRILSLKGGNARVRYREKIRLKYENQKPVQEIIVGKLLEFPTKQGNVYEITG